jgi:hypothetical protein
LRGEGSEQELPEAGDESMSRPSSDAGSGSGPDSEVADYTRIFRRVQELRKLKLRMAAEEAAKAELQLEGNRSRKRVGVQGSGSEADVGAEDSEERSPEEGAADLLQQRQWAGGFGSLGQNHGVFHHDFSSQMERAQDRYVVHVDSHQPTTWASHWNSQEMSQTVDNKSQQ